ncbi:MAG: hypothetical protein R8M45_01320 [Ghiorsea sp.]
MSKPLETLCNIMSEVHAQIQRDFKDIDPIMGVNQRMREIGIASDIITIDCIKTQKRILLVLHDEQADTISYQFCFRNQDPSDTFEQLPLHELTEKILYDWIKNYFSPTTPS